MSGERSKVWLPNQLRTRFGPRAALAALIGAWIAIQVAFSPVAFRIDEPNILALARQIAHSPLDPYGFKINWTGIELPALQVLANPPLLPAFLAAWASVFGWSEVSIHVALLPFSVGVLIGFASLARRLGARPPLAAAFLAMSPAFFLGSQVATPDVPMLAFLLVAVERAMSYADEGRPRDAFAAAGCGFIAAIVKYNAVVLTVPVGLLILFAPASRRVRLAAIAMAPFLGIATFNALTWAIYGETHFAAIWKLESGGEAPILPYVVPALALAIVPFALLPISRLKGWRDALGFAGLAIAAFAVAAPLRYPPQATVLLALGTAAGIGLLIMFLRISFAAVRVRDRDTLLLLGLVFATIAFQFTLLFPSVRYLLTMVPAVILILMLNGGPRPVAVLLLANLMLTIGLAVGDARQANQGRFVVRERIAPALDGATRLVFAGHWGFQHYAEAIGGVSAEAGERIVLQPGEIFAVDRTAVPPILEARAGSGTRLTRTTLRITDHYPLQTISCEAASHFYASFLVDCASPLISLPWGVAPRTTRSYLIFRAEGVGTEPRSSVAAVAPAGYPSVFDPGHYLNTHPRHEEYGYAIE